MQSKFAVFLILISLYAETIASVIFHCTDPVSNASVYSDRPCQFTPSTKLNIQPVNQIRGITQYERTLIDTLDSHKSSKYRKNPVSTPTERAKSDLAIHCIRNQLRIDKISLKLKQGYKSKKYNEYHDKLRLYKKFRGQHCM